jgi:transcriptional regulator with XRE-family HTH domain
LTQQILGGDQMNGKQIKQIIVNSGLKQTYIASQIGVNPATLNYFLNGKANLKESKLHRLYDILKIEH